MDERMGCKEIGKEVSVKNTELEEEMMSIVRATFRERMDRLIIFKNGVPIFRGRKGNTEYMFQQLIKMSCKGKEEILFNILRAICEYKEDEEYIIDNKLRKKVFVDIYENVSEITKLCLSICKHTSKRLEDLIIIETEMLLDLEKNNIEINI